MSGILQKSARPALLNLRRTIPLSCTDRLQGRIASVDTDHKHGMLKVRWDDGLEQKFPYVWLQDCAPPAGASWIRNPVPNETPLPLLAELNLEVKPENVEIEPIGQGVMIEWPPYNKVNYPANWLRMHLVSEGNLGLERVTVWDRSVIRDLGGVPEISIHQSSGEILRAFQRYGIIRMRKGLHLKKEILSLFGVPVERSDNDSFFPTCHAQHVNDLHTGVPFQDPIPNLGLVGIGQKPSYGQLQFVDGFMVAKIMREQHPFTFRYLCTTKVNYCRINRRSGFDQNMLVNDMNYYGSQRNLQPVFVLKEDELHVDRVVFSSPYRSSRQFHISPAAMHEFYAALKMFNTVSYDPATVINIAPEEGDLFLIDNNRVLHGTTAFDGKKASREIVESFYYLPDQESLPA